MQDRYVGDIGDFGKFALLRKLSAGRRLGIAWRERRKWRKNWFRTVMDTLSECDLVFADPDNGLCKDEGWSGSRRTKWKRLPLEEAKKLCKNGKRTTVLYHHNTRKKGGHRKENQDWMKRLPRCAHAFYWRRYSNRTYFIINADHEIVEQLVEFAETWSSAGELIRTDIGIG